MRNASESHRSVERSWQSKLSGKSSEKSMYSPRIIRSRRRSGTVGRALDPGKGGSAALARSTTGGVLALTGCVSDDGGDALLFALKIWILHVLVPPYNIRQVSN